jgi:hypothetical protein
MRGAALLGAESMFIFKWTFLDHIICTNASKTDQIMPAKREKDERALH